MKQNWIKKHPIATIFLAVLVIFVSLVAIIGMSTDTPTTTNSLSTGETGKLYLEGNTLVPVCTTKAYLGELTDASVAKDQIGYKNLIYSPKCYMATTIEPYGNVLVLDSGFGTRKVRFTHPDSFHYGETVWTYMEFITK